jgi:hypothetical protein
MIITVIIKRATRAIAFVCKFCHLVKREYKYLALALAFDVHSPFFCLFSSLLLLPFFHKKRARAAFNKTTTKLLLPATRADARSRLSRSLFLTLYIPSRSGLREARLKRERITSEIGVTAPLPAREERERDALLFPALPLLSSFTGTREI